MSHRVALHTYAASFQDMFGWDGSPTSALDAAIRRAIELTLKTTDAPIIGLPPPVRLRACGALEAWEQARAVDAGAGQHLTARLKDRSVPPLALLDEQESFIRQNCSFDFEGRFHKVLLRHSVLSVYRQAFWSRGGALYEPSAALRGLLDDSDIADDLPISLVKLPAPAVCVVPDHAVQDAEGGFQAMLVFEHDPPAETQGMQRAMTFVLHGKRGDEAVVIGIGDPNTRVADAFRKALEHVKFSRPEGTQAPDSGELAYQSWHAHLSYVLKVLLYLQLYPDQSQEELAYSQRPKEFPGLGKRKREMRRAEAERLYDRYIVGPAVLSGTTSGAHYEHGELSVAPHWRRGHFRLQPHGPQSSLRKVRFIAPTVVGTGRL